MWKKLLSFGGGVAGGAAVGAVVSKILELLLNVLKTPLYLGGIVAMFTLFPNTMKWLFLQIGIIGMKIFVSIINILMPSVFSDLNGQEISLSDIWNENFAVLPADILEVISKLGVPEMLGMIISTLILGFTLRTYFKIIDRIANTNVG